MGISFLRNLQTGGPKWPSLVIQGMIQAMIQAMIQGMIQGNHDFL